MWPAALVTRDDTQVQAVVIAPCSTVPLADSITALYTIPLTATESCRMSQSDTDRRDGTAPAPRFEPVGWAQPRFGCIEPKLSPRGHHSE